MENINFHDHCLFRIENINLYDHSYLWDEGGEFVFTIVCEYILPIKYWINKININPKLNGKNVFTY